MNCETILAVVFASKLVRRADFMASYCGLECILNSQKPFIDGF